MTHHRGTGAVFLAALLLTLWAGWGLAGCAAAVPDVALRTTSADTTLLREMMSKIEADEYQNIHSVLIVTADSVVLEAYFDGFDARTPHQLRSATKAVGSILVGVAIDRGFLPSEEVEVYSYFQHDYEPVDGWTDEAREIRIRDFLSMTSGYDCDDLTGETRFGCENAMYEAGDWVQYALDLGIAHPRGTYWAYNSSSLILVGEVVARSSGRSVADFAREYLFSPLGIERFEWARSPKGRAWVGGGARALPREMAKIGRLMLSRGVWGDTRILSERWIDVSTAPQAEYDAGVDYGYIWQMGRFWIGGDEIPAYWASGNGGQYIVVFPDHGFVVVFTGGNYDSPLADQPFRMMDRYILPAMLRPPDASYVSLDEEARARLAGTYLLDFEPTVACVIETAEEGLRMLTPEQEIVTLSAHSPTWFEGTSRYGQVHVVFAEGADGSPGQVTVYGSGSTFRFLRTP